MDVEKNEMAITDFVNRCEEIRHWTGAFNIIKPLNVVYKSDNYNKPYVYSDCEVSVIEEYGQRSVVIDCLANKRYAFCTFSAKFVDMSFSNDVLTIKGKDARKTGKGDYTLTITTVD